MKHNVKRWLWYMVRWQLSTPLLAICVIFIKLNAVATVIIGNLAGAILFYHLDRLIFKDKHINTTSITFPFASVELNEWAYTEEFFAGFNAGRQGKAAKIRAARDRMVERRYKWLNRQKGGEVRDN